MRLTLTYAQNSAKFAGLCWLGTICQSRCSYTCVELLHPPFRRDRHVHVPEEGVSSFEYACLGTCQVEDGGGRRAEDVNGSPDLVLECESGWGKSCVQACVLRQVRAGWPVSETDTFSFTVTSGLEVVRWRPHFVWIAVTVGRARTFWRWLPAREDEQFPSPLTCISSHTFLSVCRTRSLQKTASPSPFCNTYATTCTVVMRRVEEFRIWLTIGFGAFGSGSCRVRLPKILLKSGLNPDRAKLQHFRGYSSA